MTDLHPESTKDNPIAELCEPVGVSKQAYYQYDEDIAIAKAIREDLPRSSIGSICLCRICYWYGRIVLSFIKNGCYSLYIIYRVDIIQSDTFLNSQKHIKT